MSGLLCKWVIQQAIAFFTSTTMLVSVVYFHFTGLAGYFSPWFLVPYVSVVLLAYISGRWLDKKLAPDDSLLLSLYVILIASVVSILGAGQLFCAVLEIHSLLKDDAFTAAKALQFGGLSSFMFAFGAWPLLVPTAAASAVIVFLLRRSKVGS